MTFDSRPYRPADLEPLTAFVIECWRRTPTPSELMCPGDFVWGVLQNASYKPEEGIRIWEQGGAVVGFVLQKRAKFDLYMAPWLSSEERSELLRAMVTHAETHALGLDPTARVSTSAARSNLETIQTLQALGYAQSPS